MIITTHLQRRQTGVEQFVDSHHHTWQIIHSTIDAPAETTAPKKEISQTLYRIFNFQTIEDTLNPSQRR